MESGNTYTKNVHVQILSIKDEINGMLNPNQSMFHLQKMVQFPMLKSTLPNLLCMQRITIHMHVLIKILRCRLHAKNDKMRQFANMKVHLGWYKVRLSGPSGRASYYAYTCRTYRCSFSFLPSHSNKIIFVFKKMKYVWAIKQPLIVYLNKPFFQENETRLSH